MKNDYIIIKDKKKKKTDDFTKSDLLGYNMNPKKSKVINGTNIDDIIIVKDEFINKVINKKIEKKFKKLLEYIASIYESDDDSSSSLMMALNEIERFKRELINKYVDYLNKKEVQKLDKKIKLIEQEVQSKLYQYQEIKEEVEEEKTSHHRR